VDNPLGYAERGIPEYWIVDPGRQAILVLTLVGDRYQSTACRDAEAIVSSTFLELNLTAADVLNGGKANSLMRGSSCTLQRLRRLGSRVGSAVIGIDGGAETCVALERDDSND
jgi:hypothetical protein